MAASSTESSATPSLTPSSSVPPSPSLASVGPTPPTESFDDLGDLQLIVGADGPDQVRFIVCSRALSRTSPVFKAMLDGPWLEKRPANRDVDWVVTLPEDDRKYMEIILALAHGSFRRIPRTIVLDDLYQLCFCIDKYDISEGLIPWVDKWCGGVEARVEFTTIGAEDAAKVLWIGWVLGNLELVERSAERLFESTKSSEVAKLTRDPTGVIRDIQKMQLEAAREIVSVVHDHWLELTAPDELGGIGMRCKSNDRPASRELCDEATLGKLTVSLAREGFQDTKIFDDFDIMSLLQAVSRIAEDNASLEALGSKHKLCGPGEEIRGLQEVSRWALPAPVTTAAYKIVTARAKKIGTDDYWADVEVE